MDARLAGLIQTATTFQVIIEEHDRDDTQYLKDLDFILESHGWAAYDRTAFISHVVENFKQLSCMLHRQLEVMRAGIIESRQKLEAA